MHILILPSWYSNTYNNLAGVFFKEQAEALAKHNNKVGVIAIQEFEVRYIYQQKKVDFHFKQFIENDVATYSIQYPAVPKLPKLRRIIKLKIFEKLFKKYIKENGKPDIVHLHSFMHGDLAILVKEKYNIPYVVTEHFSGFARNLLSERDIQMATEVFEKSNYNIAVSNGFAKLLKEKTSQHFDVVANIVNTDSFNIVQKAKRDNFEFINIAFLDKNKNQDMLIRAFCKAFKGQADVKLTIAGGGAEYDNLNLLIEELDMEKQVILYGMASRNEVRQLLQNSDAFVLSSRYETFGVVVIEALACGLPVVATKCGGPESIIQNEKIGLLTEINEESLMNALVSIKDNIKQYNSVLLRDYVEQNFSEKIVVDQLVKIYIKIILK